MLPNEVITDETVFLAKRKECNFIVNPDSMLPDFVFSRAFDHYFAVEHIYVYEFSDLLEKLSKEFRDDRVNFMAIQPDPVTFYYEKFGYYGAVSLAASNLLDKYQSVMSLDEGPASFLPRGADIGAFWGSSLQWGIYCDRFSWELAVIAISGTLDVPRISGFRCMNAKDLSAYIEAQYHRNIPAATEFTTQFLQNYSI